jgi:WhiB family redox-sensing transcriptional regulator
MLQPQQLPGTNSDVWDWQIKGLCRGEDSAMFFHPEGERGRARTQRETRAKQMCRQCPVITQCRTHALQVGEPYGIWGGLSEADRETLLKRGIGRRSA